MAVKALPETSAISEIRFAVCSLPSESQALMPRNATTQVAMIATTQVNSAVTVRRFSMA